MPDSSHLLFKTWKEEFNVFSRHTHFMNQIVLVKLNKLIVLKFYGQFQLRMFLNWFYFYIIKSINLPGIYKIYCFPSDSLEFMFYVGPLWLMEVCIFASDKRCPQSAARLQNIKNSKLSCAWGRSSQFELDFNFNVEPK